MEVEKKIEDLRERVQSVQTVMELEKSSHAASMVALQKVGPDRLLPEPFVLASRALCSG
jgi:hypothetical protein